MEFTSLVKIGENAPDQVQIVCSTLIGIFERIVERPDDSGRRRIALDSPEVADRLMPHSGGLEALFEIGFEEDDDRLVLPMTANLDTIKHLTTKLKLLKSSSAQCATPTSKDKLCATTLPLDEVKKLDKLTIQPRPKSAAKNLNNTRMAVRLQNTLDHVLMYENDELKRKALEKIPAERLREDAREKFFTYKLNMKNYEPKPYDLNDFLALELQSWFKNEFFQWVNEPDCDRCQTKEHMRFSHAAQPVSSEIIWLANNVEVYKCHKCSTLTRFPRYNHPEKLLETRKGRCGEWANCYCLCLRALDFDARYILDWTDHVWCEVYSSSQERWLHSDPCENALDKPLLYEHGWKKQLSYVIAFSFYQCLDVTWRYSSQHAAVMQRRVECDEQWLIDYTNELSRKRQVTLGQERRDQIQMRLMREIVEFLSPKQIKEGEDVGRQSGSLQWRMSRGETQVAEAVNDVVIKISRDLVRPDNGEKRLTVKYTTATDTYLRNFGAPDEPLEVKGWSKLTNRSANISMKVEHDWKMCYLARTAGADKAWLEWHMDLAADSEVAALEILCQSSCFETGQIKWTLTLTGVDSSSIELDKSKPQAENAYLKVDRANGERFRILAKPGIKLEGRRVVLRVELTGGSGDNAWQHTQLFRQRLDDRTNLFEISAFLV